MDNQNCFESLESRCLLAGVTLVTHGFQLDGERPSWLSPMVNAVASRLASYGERYVEDWVADNSALSWARQPMVPWSARSTSSGEVQVSLDWSLPSNNFIGPSVDSTRVAQLTLDEMLDPATLLAELPIQLIGHSRGGSVVAELARLLGHMGIWVEHATFLDPYPSQNAHSDPDFEITENILFADNYHTDNVAWFLGLIPTLIHGVAHEGAANFDLTSLSLDHSEVQRYYHGTIDQSATSLAGASISSSWYSGVLGPRNQFGFNLSRIGAGEDVWSRRASVDFGRGLLRAFGGSATGRTSVAPIGAQWPNVAKVEFRQGSALSVGYPLDVDFIYGDRDSASNVRLFIDLDDNPYNGNSWEVASTSLAQADMAAGSLHINTTGINPGQYRVYAQITDGQHTRYAYGDDLLVLTAQPSTGDYRLYFPEGYRSSTVNEYIPLTNPNAFPVSYQVIARYERGDRDQIIATGVLPPTSRGGITTSEAIKPELALVRADVPYALEIRSSGPIGAMMSHYDFGGATGEAFTNQTSATWIFPDVTKAPGFVLDFIVWYNPTPTDALVTLRAAYDTGTVITRDYMVLGGYRRGGLSVDGESWLAPGRFTITVTSTTPLVAAISHYELGSGLAAISLGDPASIMPAAVIPWTDSLADNEVVLVSHRADPMEVQVNVRADDGSLNQTRTVTIAAFGTIKLDRSWLNLPGGKRGVIYLASNGGFSASVIAREPERGDAIGVLAQNRAHTRWLFADGYMANASAGTLHVEYLTLYNGATAAAEVIVEYFLLDGTARTRVVQIPATTARTVKIHEEAAILDFAAAHQGQTWFSVGVRSTTAIIATMTHWDLAQGGGWVTAGTFFDT